MNKDLLVDGKAYISAIRAAKILGYATDYVGELARSGKIPARMVGRAWFVDLDALLEHKKNRRSRMRAAREARAEIAPAALVPPVSKPLLADPVPYLPALEKSAVAVPLPARSLLETLVVALVAVFIIGYSGSFVLADFLPSAPAAFDHKLADASEASVLGSVLDFFSGSHTSAKNISSGPIVTGGPANQETLGEILAGAPVKLPAVASTQSQSDLKAELEAYVRSQIALSAATPAPAPAPIVVYNQTFTSQVLGQAAAHTSAQGESITENFSQALSSLQNNGLITNPTVSGGTITGAAISGSTFSGKANLADLAFDNATGTNSTTTNLFATNGTFTSLTAGSLSVNSDTFTVGSQLNLVQSQNGTTQINARRATDTAPSGDFITYTNAAGDTPLFRVDNSGNIFAGGITNSGALTITSLSAPQFRVQYDSTNENTNSVDASGVTTFGFNGTTPKVRFTPQSNSADTFQFTDSSSAPVLSIDTAGKVATVTNLVAGNGTTTNATSTTLFSSILTVGNATTTNFFTTTGSSTNLFASNAAIGTLTFSGGNGTTTSLSTGALTYTSAVGTSATTTNLYSTGGSIDSLSFLSATGTSATTTNLFSTNGSFTNLTGTSLLSSSAIITNATTTNFFSTTASTTNLFTSALGIGTNSVNSSALVDLVSTTKGFLAPRMTDVQRDAIVSPATGLLIYNTVANEFDVYNGSTWTALGSGGGGSSQWTTSGANIYYTVGNIGVGTNQPTSARIVSINSNSTALPNSLGSTQASSTLRLGTANSALDFGTYGATGAEWIQASNPSNLGTSYPILLNPNSDSTGFVGIGTTAPSEKLDVEGTGATNVKVKSTGAFSAGLTLIPNNNAAGFTISANAAASPDLAIKNPSGTDVFHITNAGLIGIGTTTPISIFGLTVSGSGIATNNVANDAGVYITGQSGAFGKIQAINNAATAAKNLAINPDGGNVGIGTTTPSDRLSIASDALMLGFTDTDSNKHWINGIGNNADYFINEDSGLDANRRLTIKAGGNVGIGTTNPSVALEVNGGATSPIIISSTGGVQSFLQADNNVDGRVGTVTNHPFVISTNNIARATFGASGGLSIVSLAGTGNRCLKADSAGNIVAGSSDCATGGSGADNLGNHIATQNIQLSGFWLSNDGGNEGIRVDNSGNVGVGTGSPTNKLTVDSGAIDFSGTTGNFSGSGSGIYQSATNKLTFVTAGNQRVSIDASGNVGIGSTSPSTLLVVEGSNSTDVAATIKNTFTSGGNSRYATLALSGNNGSIQGIFRADAAGLGPAGVASVILGATTNQALSFITNNTNRVLIDTSGNVGIGTTTTSDLNGSTRLNIQGPAGADVLGLTDGTDQFGIYINHTSTTGNQTLVGTLTNHSMAFITNDVNRMLIDASGNVGIGTTSPTSLLSIECSATNSFCGEYIKNTAATGAISRFSIGQTNTEAVGLLTQFDASSGNALILNRKTSTGTLDLDTTGGGIRIDNSGHVGIGTTTPSSELTIARIGSTRYHTELDGANIYIDDFSGTSAFSIGTPTGSDDNIQLTTAGSPRLYVANGGNIGIGTTTPAYELDLGGGTTVANRLAVRRGSDDTNQYLTLGWNSLSTHRDNVSTTSNLTTFQINQVGSDGTRTPFYIETNGSVGIGTTAPAEQLSVKAGTAPKIALGVYTDTGGRGIALRTSDYAAGTTGSSLRFGMGAGTGDTYASIQQHLAGENGTYGNIALNPSGGNVGIGTTAPGSKLDLANGTLDFSNSSLSQPATGVMPANTGLKLQTATTGGGLIEAISGIDTNALSLYGASGVASPTNAVVRLVAMQTDGGTSLTSLNSTSQAFAFDNLVSRLLTILGNGNVGIGTSNPSAKLEVAGGIKISGSGNGLTFPDGSTITSNSAAGTGISSATDVSLVADNDSNGSGVMTFSSDGAERVRITNAGKVGIGTTNPTNLFHVQSSTSGIANFYSSTSVQPSDNNSGPVNIGYNGTFGINKGGWISFQTAFTGSTATDVAGVGGFKENATDGDYGGYLGFFTRPNGGVDTERMRISSMGNVGIGTTAPGVKLSLGATTEDTAGSKIAVFESSGSAFYGIGLSKKGTNYGLGLYANTNTTATPQLFLENTGNVGIGTTTPLDRLHIMGTTSVGLGIDSPLSSNNSYLNFRQAGVIKNQIITSANTGDLNFWVNNGATNAMTMQQTTGNVGIGVTNPGSALQVNGTIRRFSADGDVTTPAAGLFLSNTSGSAANVASPAIVFDAGFGGAGAQIYSRKNPSDTGAGGNLVFETSNTSGTSVERMRINNAGLVGIGTTAPSSPLTVFGSDTSSGATNTVLRLVGANGVSNKSGGLFFKAVNSTTLASERIAIIQSADQDANARNLSINPDGGNVGIGTTNPWLPLTVNGSFAITTSNFNVNTNTGSNLDMAINSTYGSIQAASSGNSVVENLVLQPSGGNVGIGTTNPGAKLQVSATNGAAAILAVADSVGRGIRAQTQDFAGSTGSEYILEFGAGSGDTYTNLQAYKAGGTTFGTLALNASGGNVGIGTTAPTAKLEVAGGIKISGAGNGLTFPDGTTITSNASAGTGITSATDLSFAADSDANGSGVMSFATHGSTRLTISNLGDTTAGGALSSRGALAADVNNMITMDYVGTNYGRFYVNGPDTSTNGSLRFVTARSNGTNSLTPMVIDSSGNVGIGTTTPSARLDIAGASGGRGYIKFEDNNSAVGNALVGMDSSGFAVYSNTTGIPISFWTSNASSDDTLAMRIASSGNVGIGTTNPNSQFKLDVVNAGVGGSYIRVATTTNDFNDLLIGINSNMSASISNQMNGPLIFGTNNNERVRIDASGNVGIGTTTPATNLHIDSGGAFLPIMRLSAQGQNAANIGRASSFFTASVNDLAVLAPSGQNLFLGSGNNGYETITSTGFVGIGTTTPAALLTLQQGVNYPVIELTNGSGNQGAHYIGRASNFTNDASASDLAISAATGSNIVFANALSEVMRISSTGNVGIGTTAPGARLDLGTQAPGTNTALTYQMQAAGNSNWVMSQGSLYDSTSVDQYQIFNGQLTGGTKAAPTFTGSPSGGYYIRNFTGAAFANSRLDLGYFSGTGAGQTGTTTLSIVGNNVGIGTTTPAQKLDVAGSEQIETPSSGLALKFIGRSGDDLSNLLFYGNNASTLESGIQSLNTGLNLFTSIAQPITFTPNSAEAMRITSAGLVGIGVTNPSYKLQVNGITLLNGTKSDTPGDGDLYGSGTNWSLRTGTNNRFALDTFNSLGVYQESLSILRNGNVGIGLTSPVAPLEVNGADVTSAGSIGGGYQFVLANSGTGNFSIGSDASYVYLQSWSSKPLKINDQGNNTLINPNSGNVGIGIAGNPVSKLEVSGNTTIDGTSASVLTINGASGSTAGITINTASTSREGQIFFQQAATDRWQMGMAAGSATPNWYLYSQGVGANVLTANYSTGNVGIGTTSLGSRLGISRTDTTLNGSSSFWNGTVGGNLALYNPTDTTNAVTGIGLYGGTNNDAAAGIGMVQETANSVGALAFYTGGLGTSSSVPERMRITSTGNVGIGTVPLTWHASYAGKVLQLGASSAIWGTAGNDTFIGSNYYVPTGGADTAITTGAAANIYMTGGTMTFRVAPSVTAGSALTWKNSMFLDNSGNVGIGTTNPGSPLEIKGVDDQISLVRTTAGATTIGFYRNSDKSESTAGDYWEIGQGPGGDRKFGIFTNTTGQVLTINTSGNVGIGTTNPSYSLDIQKDMGNTIGVALRLANDASVSSGTPTTRLLFSNHTGAGRDGGAIDVKSNTAGGDDMSMAFWVRDNANTLQERMRINAAGNVGIGTTNPGGTLDITGNNNSRTFGVTTNASPNLAMWIPGAGNINGVSASSGNGAATIMRIAEDTGSLRSINAQGSINANGADYAEYFYQVVPGTMSVGQLASLDPATGKTHPAIAGEPLLGVVSGRPGFVGNDLYDAAHPENTALIGLTGQVPAKVSSEGGAIAIGDPISLSSVPGVGKKAGPSDAVIGIAETAWSGAGEGSVNVFLDKTANITAGFSLNASDIEGLRLDLAAATSSIADLQNLASTTAARVDALTLRVSALEADSASASSSQAVFANATASQAGLTFDSTSTPSAVTSDFFSAASLGLRQRIENIAAASVEVTHSAIYAVAGTFDKLFAREVHTDEVCISDQNGETCVTRSQLDTMLAQSGQSGTVSGITMPNDVMTNAQSSSNDAMTSGGTATSTATSTDSTEASSTPAVTTGSGDASSTPSTDTATSSPTVADAGTATSTTP